jgi:hypothetical protein
MVDDTFLPDYMLSLSEAIDDAYDPDILPEEFALVPSATQDVVEDCPFLTKYQVPLSQARGTYPMTFPKDFEPSDKDVIFGRGKSAFSHAGNRRFRMVILMNLEKYHNAKNRVDKSTIVTSIVDLIREGSPVNGGFVGKSVVTGQWMRINNKLAREKVGHALRDALSSGKEAVERCLVTSENDQGEDVKQAHLACAQQTIFRSVYRGATTRPNGVFGRSCSDKI